MKAKKTHYTILGMLRIKPMSGYDIKKMVEQSVSYFWKESYGQIYPVLRELEKNALVEVKPEKQKGKPDKKVYHIKEKGTQMLKYWLKQPAEPDSLKSEFLMKIFFAKDADNEITKQHINRYKQGAEKELQDYIEIEKHVLNHVENGLKEGENWLLTLDLGKKKCNSIIEWCNGVLEKLK